jgi:MATE family multidrug resistance protein
VGFIISPLLTASYVGRKFGPTFLSGFTLANMTGNLCTFSLLAGLFSAADTLGPQAFGAGDKKEVGLLAMRGFFFSCILLFPINVVLVLHLRFILIGLGQDVEAASHAQDWYRIFVLSLPFNILYQTIWKFLSAQHIMKPLIVVSIVSCLIILPVVLEILTEAFGFLGSAMAYVIFQGFQGTSLLLYLRWKKPYTHGTWPGISCWQEALFRTRPMLQYIHLGIGGMMAQSEWIFWEALGLIIGLLGVIPLSVHTIPNQVTMLLCLSPFSAGIALAIRMGVSLPVSVHRTKNIVKACVILVTPFFALINTAVYFASHSIIGFFTNNEEVIELAQDIWWKVCIFNMSVALFGILAGVATGLGMQWTLAFINIFWLWLFGLPAIYYFAVIQEGGLEAAWTWINFPYAGMNVCLIAAFVTSNWQGVASKIADKETKLEIKSRPRKNEVEGSEKSTLFKSSEKNCYGIL